ncbi:MAG: hypothetical protein AAF605_09075 [Myxococcota bacterium]
MNTDNAVQVRVAGFAIGMLEQPAADEAYEEVKAAITAGEKKDTEEGPKAKDFDYGFGSTLDQAGLAVRRSDDRAPKLTDFSVGPDELAEHLQGKQVEVLTREVRDAEASDGWRRICLSRLAHYSRPDAVTNTMFCGHTSAGLRMKFASPKWASISPQAIRSVCST